MSRKIQGTVRELGGQWYGKWTRADGTRTEWLLLNPAVAVDRESAKAEAARKAPKMRKIGVAADPSSETFKEWLERLHAAKEAKGLSTVKDMRGRAARWVLPVFGDKDIRTIARQDGERLVAKLDAAVADFMKQGPGKGRLSPSTAANVWGDVTHAFDEACNAKDPGLRVLEKDPLAGVRGPDAGEDRQGQILYSDELTALLRGVAVDPDTIAHVPLYRRQCYAMAVYTKARASELEALTAADVDLPHGTIIIAKQADRTSKGRSQTKATKTKRIRTVDIEPHLLPLVKALVSRPQGKGGRLLHMPPPEDRAELLRKDLLTGSGSPAGSFTWSTTPCSARSSSTTCATPASRTWPSAATRRRSSSGPAATPTSRRLRGTSPGDRPSADASETPCRACLQESSRNRPGRFPSHERP